MMKQQPDRLFQEKLENYSRPAPANAWAKIEAGMDKKKFPFFKMAIAASLLLISITTYVIWNNQDVAPSTIAHRENQSNEADKKQDSPTVDSERKADEVKQADRLAQPGREHLAEQAKERVGVQRQTSNTITKENKERISDRTEQTSDKGVSLETHTDNSSDFGVITPQEIDHDITVTTIEKEHRDESITIVLSTEDTDKYLLKSFNAEATPDEKKTSTLKKMLKKASDLKNNQDPIGDLRQMKNEILALNFKSENNADKTIKQ